MMSGASKPLVSFVIPCYNQGGYLYQSVASAEASYSGPKQILIVDDGSTVPSTARQLAEVESRFSSVTIIRQSNRGLSGARNTGLSASTGQFVQLLDADDLIAAGKVDYQVAQLSIARNVDVSVSDFLLCDETKSHFSKPGEPIAGFELSLDDFLYSWERGFSIPIHCALFRRSIFDEHRFDETARAKEDWLFWCSLAVRGRRFAYLRSHEAIYRQHESSMRRSVVSMGKSWIAAALKIDAIVARREPGFFDAAVAWFNDYYRKHPDYSAELKDPDGFRGAPRSELRDDSAQGADEDAPVLNLAGFQQRSGPAAIPISVVVPVYNHYRHLRSCIASVLMQQHDGIELVLVDDASSDPRVGVLLDSLTGRDPRLRVIRNQSNRGISAVQNQAVEAASGEFVAFLDCDDQLHPDALKEVAATLAANPSIDYLFTDRIDVDEDGKPLRTAIYGGYDTIRPSGDIRNDLLDGMVASHLKVMRRSCYLELGGCDDSVSGAQDWDLALRFALHHNLHYLPRALYLHRIHTHSVTRSDAVAQMRRTNVIRRRFAASILQADDARGAGQPLPPLQSLIDDDGKRRPDEGRGVRWFAPNEISLADVKQAYAEGRACIFDARGDYAVPWVNFLREFNSYFELIVYDRPEVHAALNGYLWSDAILCCPLRRRLEKGPARRVTSSEGELARP